MGVCDACDGTKNDNETPNNKNTIQKEKEDKNQEDLEEDKNEESFGSFGLDDSDEIDKRIILELANTKYKVFFNKAFGKNYYEKYITFLEAYSKIFELSFHLKTTFYTLSFIEVKNIIEGSKKKENECLISDTFYDLVVNNKKKYEQMNHYYNYKSFQEIYKIFLELGDLHVEIIISLINIYIYSKKINIDNLTYSFIKYFRDIGFCIKIFHFSLNDFLLKQIFEGYDYSVDIRIEHFLNLLDNLSSKSVFPPDLLNLAAKSTRIKDTIILGDKHFRNYIRELNLPSKRIYELDDDRLEPFFKNPYKENNKYIITKYFVICDENSEKKYLDKFNILSSKYGFAYLFLIYLKNEKLSNVIHCLIKEEKSIIYIYDDAELFEIYKENNEQLKPSLLIYLNQYKYFGKLKKDLLYIDVIDFKSTSEDGWDLFEFDKVNFNFRLTITLGNFNAFVNEVLISMIESYKENNSLDIFCKYYSNYFFLRLQQEFFMNMTAYAKMFLYAYTSEEGDPHKNLYCIINDDLRSSIPEKITRHFHLIKLIGGLIKTKRLKCFNGTVYRASFLKNELIKKIKIGLTITNSAFWSATKKLSVAKKFLNENHKNALIITEGLNNNVDIHLEEISKYPNEEEVLFLPFCTFKIESFDMIKEGKLIYYKLVLKSDSDSSLIKPLSEETIKVLNNEQYKCNC